MYKYLFKDPGLCQDCIKWFTVGNIYQQEGQDYWIVQLIYSTSKYRMYGGNTILCGQQWRQYLNFKCNQSCIGLDKVTWEVGPCTACGKHKCYIQQCWEDNEKRWLWTESKYVSIKHTSLKQAQRRIQMCSRDEQSGTSSNEQSSTTCTRNIKNKNCQAEKSVIMWPKKPKMDMQSNESAMLIQHKMTKMSKKSNIVPQEEDKKCQSTKYYGKMCSDKTCQENINIWPVKPQMDVRLMNPPMKSSSKKLIRSAKDKNCQATISNKKKRNIHMTTLKVNLQDILTRTVKKRKISICSLWTIQIFGYPRQQWDQCTIMTKSESEGTILPLSFSYVVSNENIWYGVRRTDCQQIVHSLK